MKNKKSHTIGTIPKSYIKIVERGKIGTSNTQTHDHSLSWLGTLIPLTHKHMTAHFPGLVH